MSKLDISNYPSIKNLPGYPIVYALLKIIANYPLAIDSPIQTRLRKID